MTRFVAGARLLSFALLAVGACARADGPPAAPPAPGGAASGGPDWASGFQHRARWDRGLSAVVMEVEVAPGFHAYTTGETTGKPLALELSPETAWLQEGPVAAPQGTAKDLPIGRSVIVEGRAELVLRVRPKDGVAPTPVQGLLRYQVCTERACDRPRTAPFAVAAGP